jgi:hypothetical protein
MTRPSRANRRDANEGPIVELWRNMGAIWIPQQPGAGFDGVLIAQNGIHLVEVKNAQTRWKLTPDELALKAIVEATGQRYNVIETIEDAARMIDREVWDESERVGR